MMYGLMMVSFDDRIDIQNSYSVNGYRKKMTYGIISKELPVEGRGPIAGKRNKERPQS